MTIRPSEHVASASAPRLSPGDAVVAPRAVRRELVEPQAPAVVNVTESLSDAGDPVAREIVGQARAALRPRLPQALALRVPDSWPGAVSGVIKRRLDEGKIVTTFVADQSSDTAIPPLTLESDQVAGVLNNARVTLVREQGRHGVDAGTRPEAFAASLIARVEERAGALWAAPVSALSALPALPLGDARGVSVGDLLVAERRVHPDGTSYAVPSSEPGWRRLDERRAQTLSIVVDEAGIDIVLPEAVRNDVTAVLATKPVDLASLTAAGYRDLTHLEFYTTDNPDREGGKPSRDFDQAVALEERQGGGYVIYRAVADPNYFFDLFPDGQRSPAARHALHRAMTTYVHPDDAPIYDRRLSEGAMSLGAGGTRPSFVVRLEIDGSGRIVSNEDGSPRVEIIDAAISVRYNGSYWDSEHYLTAGDTQGMPPGYRAYWDMARRIGELAGVAPRSSEELLSKAVESYFSQIVNGVITREIGRLLKARALYDANGPKYVSRYQPASEAAAVDAFFALMDALDVDVPDAPALAELARGITPDDDRWAGLATALGLPSPFPVSKVYAALDALALSPDGERMTDVVGALWTPREQARAAIRELALDPQLQDILEYNFIRKMRRAVVSSTENGHYDVGRLFYGWVTAPMRRTVDAVNQALWRALASGDLARAKRILAELPRIVVQHERVQKQLDFVARETAQRDVATELLPYEKGAPLRGVVRYIGLEGVEVAIEHPAVSTLVPMKWIRKRLGGRGVTPAEDGSALLLGNDIVVHVGQSLAVRVDRADPAQRKVYLDIVELDGFAPGDTRPNLR